MTDVRWSDGPAYAAAIAMVTPSANLVVERVTTAILADFPEVSGHFSRTPVFGTTDPFADDYDWEGMMGAARLLAQARPDVISWNGSKGATLGFSADREFCRRVLEETAILATSSCIALQQALELLRARRIAVVSPYSAAYQDKLVRGFQREGLTVVAEAHAGIEDNLDYARVPADMIADMVRRVGAAGPDAVLTWCTNFPAAPLVAALERDIGIPMLDSVALAVWHPLRMLGLLDGRGRRWGSLFERAAA